MAAHAPSEESARPGQTRTGACKGQIADVEINRDWLFESNDLNHSINFAHVHTNWTALLLDFERSGYARGVRNTVACSRLTTFNMDSCRALVVTRWLRTPLQTSDPRVKPLVIAVFWNIAKHCRALRRLAEVFREVGNLACEA